MSHDRHLHAQTGAFRPGAVPVPGAAPIVSIAAGSVFGLATLALYGLDVRWVVYVTAAVICGTAVSFVRERQRFLMSAFILSLQAGVYLRSFYGYAGSDGFALSLPAVFGLPLLASQMLGVRTPGASRLQWGGRLTPWILGGLATSVIAFLFSSERFIGATTIFSELQLYLMYLVALNTIRSKEELDVVGRCLLWSLIIQSLVYVIQNLYGINFNLVGEVTVRGDLPRPGGTVTSNPQGFAMFITPLWFIAVAMFLRGEKGRRSGGFVLCSVVLGVIDVILTFTRAAWSGFAIGLVAFVALTPVRRGIRLSRGVVVALAIGCFAAAFAPSITARLAESTVSDAYDERAGLMRVAWSMIEANPLVGVGPGAYRYTYRGFVPRDVEGQWLYAVHNKYLLRAAEVGVAGGVLYVLLLVAGLRQALRLGKSHSPEVASMAAGWAAGLVALAWQMYWDPSFDFPYNALLWFMLGLMESMERLESHRPVEISVERDLYPAVLSITPAATVG